jgi:hypothetical protein
MIVNVFHRRAGQEIQLQNETHLDFCFVCIMTVETGGRLTEIHLIEIVFFHLIESFN